MKTRTSSAALVEGGRVRVNGQREKASSHNVKIGDVVTVTLDNTIRLMKVTGFAERRGDATAAKLLFEELRGETE